MSGTLKLIRKPRRLPVNFKWLSNCASQTGFISSTAFNSQIISPSTKTSNFSPSSKTIPSYIIGMQPAFDILTLVWIAHGKSIFHKPFQANPLLISYAHYRLHQQFLLQWILLFPIWEQNSFFLLCAFAP